MDDANSHEAKNVDFPEVQAMDIPATAHLCMEDLASVPLFLTVELGTAKMKVRDVLELKVGSIVSLDKLAGEMTDVQLGSRGIARGEVVTIDNTYGVRITSVDSDGN